MEDDPRTTVMDEEGAGAPAALRASDPPLHLAGRVSPSPRVQYRMHPFDLAPGATRLTVRLHFHKERLCQLFLAVFDPQEYRGTRMNPAGYGDITLELQFGEREAGPGALPGPLRPGRWRVMVDIERTIETADYVIEVIAEAEAEAEAEAAATDVLADGPEGRATAESHDAASGMRGAGWYRGELHAHSWNSDGKVPVWQVIEAARAYGLDFLALTDHFTTAGWRDLIGAGGSDLALLHGLELTGHSGHANLHGLHQWVNIYADGPALDMQGRVTPVGPAETTALDAQWDINAVARAAHEQGGLFCVNHPFSGDLGWRYHEFDWNLADLMEVYHHLEGPHNALSLGLWDEQLRQGKRIVGVAGIDSHHPREQRHRLGQCFTWVHALQLSEAGIIAGLRAGRVYVSLGPRLDYWAEGAGSDRIEMGDTAPCGTPLQFHVELSDLRYPAQLYLLKNGFYHESVALAPGSSCMVDFTDTPTAPGYYRVELYADQPQETRPYRQPSTFLLLSNPIFVR